MRFGLRFRTPKPPTPAPRRRPTPDEQCTEVAASTGRQCSNFAKEDGRCKRHPPEAQRRSALTASVAVVDLEGATWATWKFGSRDWQVEAWRIYDIMGPLRFVANWVGNSVSRCRLYVSEVDDAGEATQEATDPDIAQLALGPLGQGPAKDEALRLLGINLFVAGEAYVIAEADALEGGGDRWFVTSGAHIRRRGGEVTIRRSQLYGGGDMIYRQGIDLIIRVWTPHPNDTDEPDSSTRAALPDLRKLEAIGKRQYAELDSRLTGAGVLFLPEGVDFPHEEGEAGGPEGFGQLLTRTAGTSLRNQASAEAMVPLVATLPADVIDKIKHLMFASELSKELVPWAVNAVTGVSQTLDVPPEVLVGGADSNHWSVWHSSAEAINTQIVPVLNRIADALTSGYLRSALEQMSAEPESHIYAFDPAALSAQPNRSADALNYHKEALISDQAAVEAGAWTEEDMPSQEELLRRFVWANPTVILTEQWARDILGITEPIPPPPAAPVPAPAETPPPVKDPQTPPEQTPPTEEPTAAIVALSDLAMRRALGLAGGRLVPHGQRDRDHYKGTPRHQLHTRCGVVTASKAHDVLRGAWADLADVAIELHVDPVRLQALLDNHAKDLLTRGFPYELSLLRDSIVAEMRGERLHALAGVPG